MSPPPQGIDSLEFFDGVVHPYVAGCAIASTAISITTREAMILFIY
jgi:hypothetical protein